MQSNYLSKLVLTAILLISIGSNADLKEKGGAKKLQTLTTSDVKENLDASSLAKEKGILEPTETMRWNSDHKNVPSDWVKADNKYFSVFYPNCFAIEKDGQGVGGYKNSQGISLRRMPNCASFKEGWKESNWLNINYNFLSNSRVVGIKTMYLGTHFVYRQKLSINILEAYIGATIMNDFDTENKENTIQLRWQVIIKCKNKVFFAGFTVPTGESSYTRVKNSDYQVPEDFKQILSTFQCK